MKKGKNNNRTTMRAVLLTLVAATMCMAASNASAQTFISTEQRYDDRYIDSTASLEHVGKCSDNTFFIINHDRTLVEHLTPDSTTVYFIERYQEKDELIEISALSDMGRAVHFRIDKDKKYLSIFDMYDITTFFCKRIWER